MLMWLHGAILCVSMAGVITTDTLADDADKSNERNRYESITINKPVVVRKHNIDWPVIDSDLDEKAIMAASLPTESIYDALPSVRCFCNLPECIATGYMCKSSYGGCFSDVYQPLQSSRRLYQGRHGCIELLTDKAQRERCQRLPNGNRYPASKPISKAPFEHRRSLVHCCHEDLCNHADNPQTKDLINDTSLGDQVDENRVIGSHMDTGYNDSDVWFKAATIAVPICGAVILFVLIALAIRLLKTESAYNTNYKLGCQYMQTHGKHNCNKQHELHYCRPIAEPFLRKDSIVRQHSVEYTRRSIPSPIILTKNINERYNTKHNYEYNLLPIKNNNPRVHEARKCYDNKNLAPIAAAKSTTVGADNTSISNASFTDKQINIDVNDAASCATTNVHNVNVCGPASVIIDDLSCDNTENNNSQASTTY